MLVAAGWGVVTSTAPSSGSVCTSESWASPVPGRQIDHEDVELAPFTFCTNCWMVFMIIGPRQTTGVLSSTRNPMLITFTP
jgi:hypothetical protein